jgi:aminoglycoside phosphotransferase (APT) family kinase protein
MHADQLRITESTVRQLVAAQFPQWAERSVRHVRTSATVNAIFRIGDDLAARFPVRAQDDMMTTLRQEAEAAAELAAVSPVPTPRPVAIGRPGDGYPMPWSVQTWLPGTDATVADPAGSHRFAQDLAAFISSLRAVDTRGRHFGGARGRHVRGGHLTDHDEWVDVCLRESDRLLDIAPLRAMWGELRTVPEVDADVMCHGDLIPPNVLVARGRLAAVLDGGGFAPADPALDLVCAWHLLDDGPRAELRNALSCNEIQWRRGIAWAFEQAIGLVWYYVESNPTMSRLGRRTLDRLLAASRGPKR